VTQFNERGERWIDLAQLSILYGHGGAARFVSRAADCIIGYGWRKDVWIFDVLSAVEAVHESAAADVLPWMETLAPMSDQITVFTDGDETNHVPEVFIDLTAKVKPEWLPKLYGHYIEHEKWALAEQTLAGILNQVDFTHASGVALAKSLLEKGDLVELEKLRKIGKAGVKKLLAKQRAFLGIVKSRNVVSNRDSRSGEKDDEDDLGRRGKPPDVKKFGPDQLERLLKRVASPKLGYLHRDDALLAWLRHWDHKGKGLEAVHAIDTYFKTHENPHEIEPLLDEAFDVSLKYEGKTKAYAWLVRAHVERHGWSYYWDNSGRVRRRLELAAQHYRSRWADFIRDTSKPARYWERRRNGLTIGTHWLVHYLLRVGQQKLAVRYTDTMVRLTKEELHDQPLPCPGWQS
jgi:hypothetical protein